LDSHKLLKDYSPAFKKKKALLAGTPHFKRENRFSAIDRMIQMRTSKAKGFPIRNQPLQTPCGLRRNSWYNEDRTR
jgi:hypothetical protein